MAKDITTDFFSKNVYDFKNIDESGELKFLGKNPVVVDFLARGFVVQTDLCYPPCSFDTLRVFF